MDPVRSFQVRRVVGADSGPITDQIAAEEPLSILVKYWQKDTQVTGNLALTMRTPGHDKELAVGLLLAEGVVQEPAQVVEVRALGREPANEILVELARGVDFEAWRLARNGFVSSSCGVCGKRSREALLHEVTPLLDDQFRVPAEVIHNLPLALRAHQYGFAQTGGLHAAALVTGAGEVEAVFEDIGRHNALDKLIGWAFLDGRVPLSERVLFLSSRGGFELVQKAALAGAPVLATVGGPSSLAIETARACQITLAGFVRDGRFNLYSAEWRIDS